MRVAAGIVRRAAETHCGRAPLEKVRDERAESRALLGAKVFDIVRDGERSMGYESECYDGLFNRHRRDLGADAKT